MFSVMFVLFFVSFQLRSVSERTLAMGVTELLVLVLLALLLGRWSARILVATTMTAMALTTALTTLNTICRFSNIDRLFTPPVEH